MKFRDKKTGRFVSRSTWKHKRTILQRQVRAEIWASSESITKGESVTIYWKTTYADKDEIVISGMGEQYDHKAKRNGSLVDQPEETTTYTITAKGKWFKRKKKRFRKVTVRSVTVEVETPGVVTYFKYHPKDGRKKIDIRIVTDGPFNKKDLTNIIEITVKGKTYSGKDLESFHALTWTASHQRSD